MKYFLVLLFSLISLYPHTALSEEKIKIGLLVPLSGKNNSLGKLIIKSTRMALNDIKTNNIEIYPKDTASDPNQTLKSALDLKNEGIKIVIGPIFYENLLYLDELKEMIF